jgi:hypothetical protein
MLRALLVVGVMVTGVGCGAGANGTGAITGKVDGLTEFGAVKSALWIGQPDDPADTVVFLFSTAVTCAELEKVGWDGRVELTSQMFELVAKGTTAGSYPAPPGEINHTFAKTGAERGAQSGTLTLKEGDTGRGLSGGFTATFEDAALGQSYPLSATFTAVYCPTGKEP